MWDWCNPRKTQQASADFKVSSSDTNWECEHFLEAGKGKKTVFPLGPPETNTTLLTLWFNIVWPILDLWCPGSKAINYCCFKSLCGNYSLKRRLIAYINFIQVILFGLQFTKFWCTSLVVFLYLPFVCLRDPHFHPEETFAEFPWVLHLFENFRWIYIPSANHS